MKHEPELPNPRYQIEELIAQGGMGAVYRARDRDTGQAVALKVVRTQTPALRNALVRESRLLAALHHPALPRLHDQFATDDGYVLVLDYIPGPDLAVAARAMGESLPVATVLTWADQIIEVLAFLHAQNPPIVHRDLKPANLKLHANGQVMLLDFGLAKGGTDQTTLHPSLPGYTLAYAPLEQIRGEGTSPQSDIYALGATLYDLLTGERPPDALARIAALLAGQPDPLRPANALRPDLPTGLVAALQQALALRPAQRPADVRAFSRQLHAPLPTRRAAPAPGHPLISVPHNLPTPPTPLIGRDTEVASLHTLLAHPEVRLLTLIGAAGVGKSRLALHVVAGLSERCPDGIFLVDLTALADPDLFAETLALRLDLPPEGSQPAQVRLSAFVRSRRLALLLDNLEHLLDVAPLLADLLASAPGLCMLVTSREPLRLRAEHRFEVPPLAVPPLDPLPTLVDLAATPAVACFVERARATNYTFVLDETNAAAVAALCVALDGLPLALELAAARMHEQPPTALLSQLEARLDLLVDGPRDLPTHQRTLRDAIAWSYDRLSRTEQALFSCLGVFRGGARLSDVSEVLRALLSHAPDAAPWLSEPLTDEDVTRLAESLAARSLLRYETHEVTGLRVTLLESLRVFAHEQLQVRGMLPEAQTAHSMALLRLAETAAPELRGPDQATWLAQLEQDHPNLRAALAWLLNAPYPAEAQRLGAALWRFWYARGHWSEGRRWLERLLAQPDQPADATYATVFEGAAMLATNQDDYVNATTYYESCLQLRRTLGDINGVSVVLNSLGVLADLQGDYARAATLHRENLALRRSLGNQRGIATALSNLGIVANELGDHVEAATVFAESLSIHRELDDPRGTAIALGNLGMTALYQGEYARAEQCFQECLSTFTTLGHKIYIAVARNNLGTVALYQGDQAKARDQLRASLHLYRELGNWQYAPGAIEGLAALAAMDGQAQPAATLFGAAAALREAVSSPVPPAERARYAELVALAQQQLDPAQWQSAWETGQALIKIIASSILLEDQNPFDA